MRLVAKLALLLAAVVGGLLALPSPAYAIEYEIFVDVEDEEGLLELLNTEQISEATFNTLLELVRRGTNLETVDREGLYALPNLTYEDVDSILAYRDEAGRIGDPANLVAAGALSKRKLQSIAIFLVVPRPPGGPIGADGFVRYQAIWTVEDDRVPPMFLQGRVTTFQHLTLGAAAGLDRNRIGDVRHDPNRDALSAEGERPRVRLPKAFVQWETDDWGIIAGTYRIGFGQRLVFDSTSRYTPNGFYLDHTVQRRYDLTRLCKESTGELGESPCADGLGDIRVTPDYVFRPGQQGLAVGAKRLPLPTGWLQTYGWFSLQNRDIYQYQVYDRDRCSDPTDSMDDPLCDAPNVYKRGDPALAPTSRFSFQTLPNMYNEVLGGGNASYYYNRRTHVGITGYGADTQWLTRETDLDFKDWARTPYGGPYGAIGGDFGWGRKAVDVFAEVAHSFDSMQRETPDQGGGGFAAVVRQTTTLDNHEVEVSARYYDPDYANPFAGPIAAPDQLDGLRARDEAGARVRYNAHLADRVDLRTFADFWVDISESRPAMRLYARSDVQTTEWLRPGLWLEYQRRDLRSTDAVLCAQSEADENSAPRQCGGQRFSVTLRSRFDPIRRLYFSLQYRHDIQDDNYEGGGASFDDGDPNGQFNLGDVVALEDFDDLSLESRQRQDVNAFFVIAANPIDPLRLRGRVRWFWEDITDNTRFEHSVWTYFDVSYTIRRWAIPRLRYDLVFYVDDRDSTADRIPNPEHWLLFEWTSRF